MDELRFNLISASSSVLLALSLYTWASAATAASPLFDCRDAQPVTLLDAASAQIIFSILLLPF